MNDAGFILAGYGVILGGLALYAVTLLRRLAAARRAAGSLLPDDLEGGG
jgi:hypothetical protein